MRTTYPLPNPCWHCNAPNDAVSDLTGEKKPYPGAISLCVECGAPGILTETMTSREPTDDELKDILRSQQVRRMMAAIALSHGRVVFIGKGKG